MYNIGIDGHMIGDHSGGNESYYTNILRNMDSPENCRLFLFLRPGVKAFPYEEKFEIIRFRSKNAFVRNFIELPYLCKKLGLDLLHVQYFIPFWRPCKVVCLIHDICFEHFKDIFTRKEYYRQKILIPYAATRSEIVFTVSNHAKRDIQEHYGLSDEKVCVTYNAVNSSFRRLDECELNIEELKRKYEINESRYILSVCNLQPRKNIVRLINAFINMKEIYGGNEQLVIVGKKAWMFNDILKVAIQESKDIIFTDYVSDDDLVRLYNGAACFVYPSFFEGFGIPPLEAMACGTPVAVSAATALPEVVADAGVYFDPYSEDDIRDAIHRILKDDELCRRLENAGYQQVTKFSWKESARIITDTYLRLLERE